jgi:RNA polymerase sigma-70 factor, ECF subfamily
VTAPEAFRQQLLAALPRLRRYARSLAFDGTVADDVTQSTVERALSHWHQFDQRRDLVVWLLAIAHNAFLDMRRHDGRMFATDPADVQRAADERAQHHQGNADSLSLRVDLLAALHRLSPEQREPLLLVCVEQFSYAEVAEVLSIPVGTVMSRVFRARAALRLSLDGKATSPVLRRVV